MKPLSPLLASKLWALGAVIPFLAAIGAWQGGLWLKHRIEWGHVKHSGFEVIRGLNTYYTEHKEFPEKLEDLLKLGYAYPESLKLREGATLKYSRPVTNAAGSEIVLECTYLQYRMFMDKAFNYTEQ